LECACFRLNANSRSTGNTVRHWQEDAKLALCVYVLYDCSFHNLQMLLALHSPCMRAVLAYGWCQQAALSDLPSLDLSKGCHGHGPYPACIFVYNEGVKGCKRLRVPQIRIRARPKAPYVEGRLIEICALYPEYFILFVPGQQIHEPLDFFLSARY